MFFVFGCKQPIEPIDGVISYGIRLRNWAVLPSMPDARGQPAAAALGLGGWHVFSLYSEAHMRRTDSKLVVAAMKVVPSLTHFPPGLLPLIATFLGPNSIFFAGGWNAKVGRTVDSAVCYSLDSCSWRTDVSSMRTARGSAATVAIGGRMMVFGGLHENPKTQHLSSCEAFDPITNEWTVLSPMSTRRCYACAVAWESRAFVFGGHDGWSALSSVECFDSALNTWSAIAPMSTARYQAAVVAVSGCGLIVMGGLGADGLALQSAELYDPTTNEWTAVSWQLPKPVYSFAAHCFDGVVLHIVGGIINSHLALTGWRPTACCWSMDLSATAPIWLSLPPMPECIHLHGSVAV